MGIEAIMQEQVYLVIGIAVFVIGLISIVKAFGKAYTWVENKIKLMIYGEPITPFKLFTIDGWTYNPNRVVDRFKD